MVAVIVEILGRIFEIEAVKHGALARVPDKESGPVIIRLYDTIGGTRR